MEGDDAMKGQEHPALHDIPIGIDATGQRHETDSMGGIDVPADRYWGAQTQRSLVHFAIGNDRMPKHVYHAYGYVKKAAALVNAAAGRYPGFNRRFVILGFASNIGMTRAPMAAGATCFVAIVMVLSALLSAPSRLGAQVLRNPETPYHLTHRAFRASAMQAWREVVAAA
jgi:hypothetical protein